MINSCLKRPYFYWASLFLEAKWFNKFLPPAKVMFSQVSVIMFGGWEVGYMAPKILYPRTTKAGGTNPTGMLSCWMLNSDTNSCTLAHSICVPPVCTKSSTIITCLSAASPARHCRLKECSDVKKFGPILFCIGENSFSANGSITHSA